MAIVKKWIGCVVSFIAGACGLVLSACSGMIAKIDLSALGRQKTSEATKAFKVITDKSLYTSAKEAGVGAEFVWLKVFAIITLIISILLIISAVLLLLRNLNVIKLHNNVLDIINISLLIALLASTIGLLITTNIYASAMEKAILDDYKLVLGDAISKIKIDLSAGVYQPTMLAISAVSAVAAGTCMFLNKKAA